MTVSTTFSEVGDDAPAFLRLTIAANDAWQAAVLPEATSTTAAEFERMTGHDDMAQLIHSPDDADGWIRAMVAVGREEAGFTPTIGATYLPSNLTKILDLIAKAEVAEERAELVWLRPGGSTWGRTLRVAEALAQIRTASRNVGQLELQTMVAMARSVHRGMRMIHKRLFERGFLLPSGHLPANLEVLYTPGVGAFLNVHLRMGTHSIAVGGIVTDPKQLARTLERLTPSQVVGWEEIWRPRKEIAPGRVQRVD